MCLILRLLGFDDFFFLCFGQRRCSLYLTLGLYCVPQPLASVMLYVRSSLEERSQFKLDWDWKKANYNPFLLLSSAMSTMLLLATTSHTREAT